MRLSTFFQHRILNRDQVKAADDSGLPSPLNQTTDWIDQYDPDDPHNWPRARKLLSLFTVAGVSFTSTLAASLYSPSYRDVSTDFKTSYTIALLPLSLYNLGLALGPVIGAPLSETVGRKSVYLITTPIFIQFILASGLSTSVYSLVICRFLAGVFASPGISVAAATIADFAYQQDRAIPLAVYYCMPFLGAVLGPLIGSFIISTKAWQWTQWTTIFFALATFIPVLFIDESYKKIILQRRAKRLGFSGVSSGVVHHQPSPTSSASDSSITTSKYTSLWEKARPFITATIKRPIHMLFTEAVVTLLCIYMSFIFGLLYCFIIASPYVFGTVYDFNIQQRGLSFSGFIVGCFLATIILVLFDQLVYQPRIRSGSSGSATSLERNGSIWEKSDTPDGVPPEIRLQCAMLGSILLPVGLFWFAWTAQPGIHWICPIISQTVTITGALLVYVSSNLYLMDIYGPLYGASANGASSLTRYTLSAAFPLFTLKMFQGLGIAWAGSLLGFFTLALMPIPWVLAWYGKSLRARTRYPRS